MEIVLDGFRCHYLQEGQGTDLVLIHGLGGSLSDWDAFVPALSRYHRTLRFDVRGFGHSDKPPGPYSPQLFACDLANLLRALQLPAVHVVGISMGGVIAQRLALDYPERVRSLTLISTSSEVGAQARAAWEKMAAVIEQRGFAANASFAERIFAPRFVQNHPEVVRDMAARTAANDPRAYAAAARAIGSYNWTAELERIQVPTLILQGLEDALTPPGGSVRMQRALPRARLLLIPDCGHVIPLEKPELFTHTLLAFLAGVDLSG
ncbi:MAG: alpha/beta hydrolase [Candidatus Binatia bacterium]|nr:alpha/beta hydrolase [Candidatus Binatia bacterium]